MLGIVARSLYRRGEARQGVRHLIRIRRVRGVHSYLVRSTSEPDPAAVVVAASTSTSSESSAAATTTTAVAPAAVPASSTSRC